MNAFMPGDILRVFLDRFYHYGIYVGEDQVIHYAAENGFSLANLYKLEVTKTSVEIFSQGNSVEIWKLPQPLVNKRFAPSEIVEKAEAAIGEALYDLLYNNCEHFVCRCSTGIAYSALTESILKGKLPGRKATPLSQFYFGLSQSIKNLGRMTKTIKQ